LKQEVPVEAVTPALAVALARRTGFTDKGESLLREALAARPADFWLNHSLGMRHTGQRLAEAEGYLRAALAVRPNSSESHFQLGWCVDKQGRLEEAVAYYRRALQLNPGLGMACNNLGWALKRQGKVEESAACYRRAIDLEPENATARVNLANVLFFQGKSDEAATILRRVVALKPGDASRHYQIAFVLHSHDRLEEAASYYRSFIEYEPNNPVSYAHLADVLLRQGKPEEAAACARKAVEIGPSTNPGKVVAYINLARAQLALGNYPEAERATRSAMTFVPASVHDPEIETTRRQALLGKRLSAILRGDEQPADALEAADFAGICKYQRRYLDAAKLYAGVFAAFPKLADDLRSAHLYHAACSAVLASQCAGNSATKLDDRERSRWRRQALEWLRADLQRRNGQQRHTAAMGEAPIGLQNWLNTSALAGVRDPAALAQLPDGERNEWDAFWGQVKSTLAKPADQ
jgi:tetratricopeptide (TPR) repeat protein